MTSTQVACGALLLFVFALVWSMVRENNKRKKKFLEKIKKSWGAVPTREYSWDELEQIFVNCIMLEDGDGCYGYKFAADTIEAAKAGFHEVIWMAIELKQYRSGQDFSVNSFIEDGDGKNVESDREGHIVINRVVTTQEPSKYINWEMAGTLPFIYTVDREKSEWKLHAT